MERNGSRCCKFCKRLSTGTVAEDQQPGVQAFLELRHPERRLQLFAFDIQTITPRTKNGNIKVLAMTDMFSRFVRAKAIPDEKAETIASVSIEE